MAAFEPVLTAHFHVDGAWTLAYYQGHGGYEAARKAITTLTPEAVTDEVVRSNLCGRGGAFFPTGKKWQFLPKDAPTRYLVVNADESEPGTFKDRAILEWDPHALLEGALLAAYAIKTHVIYVYIRGEFAFATRRLEAAIAEAYGAGLFGRRIFGTDYDCEIYVHRGAGAYICGEETALLTSLEGNRGYPRLKPPFPAVKGAFDQPTIVNNVETLANIPPIFSRGAEWYAKIGAEKTPGPKIYCLCGHVEKPGLYEAPMGIPLRELIESKDYAGGVWKGRKLKAVVPGGSSVPVLRADEIDVGMDFFSLRARNTMLGSAGVIVMDETTCMADALLNVLRFYHHESCGQCTPCREGTGWIVTILTRILRGQGTSADIDLLVEAACNMRGRTICPLADAAIMPAESYVLKFREDFERYVKKPAPLQQARVPAGIGKGMDA